MRPNKILFVPFLLLLFSNIYQAEHCDVCKTVNYVNKFSVDQLQGVWYLTAKYDEANDYHDCLQIKYTKIDCLNLNVQFCFQDSPNQVMCLPNGTYSAFDPDNPDGHALFEIPNLEPIYEIFLLYIDEDYYAVFYVCKTYSDGSQFEEYSLLTRNRTLDYYDPIEITQIFVNHGLDPSKLLLVKQDEECKYEFQPTH